MNVRTEAELDRIFAEFHEDRQSGHPRPLTAWMTEHPDLGSDFVSWSTEMPSLDTADLCPISPDLEARSLAMGRSILQRMGLSANSASTISSLNDAARACGKKPRELAQAIGIGISLFAKLNRRLIQAATVPESLAKRLSAELNVTLADLRAYFAQAPTLAEGAAYRSESVPEAVAAQDFAEAIRTCTDMSPEQKQQWL